MKKPAKFNVTISKVDENNNVVELINRDFQLLRAAKKFLVSYWNRKKYANTTMLLTECGETPVELFKVNPGDPVNTDNINAVEMPVAA